MRDRPERVITVFAPKGGVGKTTLATGLLAAARMEGIDAVGVDLDAQASLATWAEIRARQSRVPEVRTVTASPVEWPEVRRAEARRQLLVVDTPPGLDDDERLAAIRILLRDSDLALIPAQPYAATLLKLTEMGLALRARGGSRAVFVLNQVIAGRAVLREARDWLAQRGAELCPVEIPLRDHIARAMGLGLAAVEFDDSQGGAAQMRTLWRFAASRLGLLTVEAA